MGKGKLGRPRHFKMEPLSDPVTDAEIEQICAKGAFPFPLIEGVLRNGVAVSRPLALRIRAFLQKQDQRRVSISGQLPEVNFVQPSSIHVKRFTRGDRSDLPSNRTVERLPVPQLRSGMWLLVSGKRGSGWIEVLGAPKKRHNGVVSVPTSTGIVVAKTRAIAQVAVLKDD